MSKNEQNILIFSSKKNVSWLLQVQISPLFYQMVHNTRHHHILGGCKLKNFLRVFLRPITVFLTHFKSLEVE